MLIYSDSQERKLTAYRVSNAGWHFCECMTEWPLLINIKVGLGEDKKLKKKK